MSRFWSRLAGLFRPRQGQEAPLFKGQEAPLFKGKTGPEWLAALEGTDPLARDAALKALENAGPEVAGLVTLLGQQLHSRESRRRQYAVYALESIGPQAEAVAPTLRHLATQDPAPFVRLWAGCALGKLNQLPETKAALASLLKDSNRSVRGWAAIHLARLRLDPEALIPVLGEALQHPEAPVRNEAARHLSSLSFSKTLKSGPLPVPVVLALRAALADPDREVRLHSIRALKWSKDRIAPVPALVAILNDPDLEVRFQAALALQVLGSDTPLLPVLIEGLRSQERDRRAQAADALGLSKDAGAAAPLLDALGDADVEVRSKVASALRSLAGDCALPVQPFLALLKNSDGHARSTAVEVLETLAAEAKADDRRQIVAALLDTVGAAEPVLRRRALDALSAVGARGVLGAPGVAAEPAVLGALTAPEREVQLAAINALGWVGKGVAAALPALRERLQGADQEMRCHAAIALTRLDPANLPVAVLGEALGHAAASVRLSAAGALGESGLHAAAFVPGLIRLMQDENEDVREKAVAALGSIGPAAVLAVPALARALQDREVWLEAARVLGGLGPLARDAVPALTELLPNPNVLVREAAADALRRIGPAARAAPVGPSSPP